jgi:hypothetical protein
MAHFFTIILFIFFLSHHERILLSWPFCFLLSIVNLFSFWIHNRKWKSFSSNGLVDACITFTKCCSHLFKQAHRFGDVNMQTCGPDPSLLATTTVTKVGWEYVWNHCGISTYCTLYSFSSCVNFLDIGRN